MSGYSTPLHERRRLSEVQKRRYWNDPDFRLRSINRTRAYYGRPPLESLDQVGTASDGGRIAAAKAKRDERGRIVG